METSIRIITNPQEVHAVEDLQQLVWPGADTEIVPAHLLIAAITHGGLLIGAFNEQPDAMDSLLGFVFGFPGFYQTPDGPRLMHCSHLLGIHPEYRDQGIGYKLKRAQWQMVRHQGIDRIVWTYDPLISRNARLNITKLGAVCNTFLENYYGDLRDDLNIGLPTDRFLVDWWVNTQRVFVRLSWNARRHLNLDHYLNAEAKLVNPSSLRPDGLPEPGLRIDIPQIKSHSGIVVGQRGSEFPALLLVEIPADFLHLKAVDFTLAVQWRRQFREIIKELFRRGYLVTDFVHQSGNNPRSFYILSYGESTL